MKNRAIQNAERQKAMMVKAQERERIRLQKKAEEERLKEEMDLIYIAKQKLERSELRRKEIERLEEEKRREEEKFQQDEELGLLEQEQANKSKKSKKKKVSFLFNLVHHCMIPCAKFAPLTIFFHSL